MSAKQQRKPLQKKKSKRDRRIKIIIYIMIIAMVLSTLTMGLATII